MSTIKGTSLEATFWSLSSINLFIDSMTMRPYSDDANMVTSGSPFLFSGGALLLLMLFDRIMNDIRVLPKWILLKLLFSTVPQTFLAAFLTPSNSSKQQYFSFFMIISILARLYEVTMLLLIVAAQKVENFLQNHGLL